MDIKKNLYNLFDQLPGTHWILKKVRGFESRIALLESQRQEPRTGNYWKKVDLLDFGPVSVFMYVDDLAYQNTDLSVRNYSVAEHIKKMDRLATSSSEWSRLEKPDRLNLLPFICSVYKRKQLPFDFLDIGCQYGAYSLYVAHIFRELNWGNRIYAFDIGVARDLVDYNIELNRQTGRVKFEPLAVSNHCLPAMVFTELGHSENNRIINRDLSSEYESYVIRSTTVDDYLEKHEIKSNLVIKVDSQGGEYEILQGMKKCLQERVVCGLFEFTPHALQSRVSPVEFLRALSRNSLLIDIPPDDRPVRNIDRNEFQAYTQEISNNALQQSDVLVISKDLDGAETLCQEIVDGINA